MAIRHLSNLFGDQLHTLPLLVLYLTDGCNSRCVMCDIWQHPRQNMPMALVDDVVQAAAQLGVRWVLLSGGEATQHPHWDSVAQRFREQGIYVMLLTHGLSLKRQVGRAVGHVDEVIVSLDAITPSVYHAIRGVDAVSHVLEGIAAARDASLRVTTRTTLQRQNYSEIPHIIDAALALDVNQISFLAVDVDSRVAFGNRDQAVGLPPQALPPDDVDAFERILARVEEDYASAFADGRIAEPPAKLRRLADYFRAINGTGTFTPPRCNAPHISTVIEVDGRVRSCYFLPEIGKLDEMDLPTLLNSPAGKALRRAYRNGQRPECARCVCPLYKGPRALLSL